MPTVTEFAGSEARCPARAPGAQLQREDGRAIVRDARGAAVLALNDTAAALWELCDGSTSMNEMVMAICDVSSISPSRARADVETTLTRFEEAGLIAIAGPRSEAGASPRVGAGGLEDPPADRLRLTPPRADVGDGA